MAQDTIGSTGRAEKSAISRSVASCGRAATLNAATLRWNVSPMSSPVQYRILCLDGDPPGLKLRQLILERNGFLVSTAATVSEGLMLFRSEHFDVVITNHVLGEGTATAMVQEMKCLKSNVPIILLSRTSGEGNENVDAFMSKTAGTESLLVKIKELLSR